MQTALNFHSTFVFSPNERTSAALQLRCFTSRPINYTTTSYLIAIKTFPMRKKFFGFSMSRTFKSPCRFIDFSDRSTHSLLFLESRQAFRVDCSIHFGTTQSELLRAKLRVFFFLLLAARCFVALHTIFGGNDEFSLGLVQSLFHRKKKPKQAREKKKRCPCSLFNSL